MAIRSVPSDDGCLPEIHRDRARRTPPPARIYWTIRETIDPPRTLALQQVTTVDGDHGRIETRRHTICHDIKWLLSDRRYPGEFLFPGLAAVGMIESETERGGTIERQRRYYLCSAKLDAEAFAQVVRRHWGIENHLHWVLDVVFHDDLARLRSGHGPANMAIIKHTAMNLLTQAKPTTSLKNRRKKAGWNTGYQERSSAARPETFKRFPWLPSCRDLTVQFGVSRDAVR